MLASRINVTGTSIVAHCTWREPLATEREAKAMANLEVKKKNLRTAATEGPVVWFIPIVYGSFKIIIMIKSERQMRLWL
jgi:hypothetical protein